MGIYVLALSAVLAGLWPVCPAAAQTAFSHNLLDEVLQVRVDSLGWVDYTGLKTDRSRLDAYIDSLALISPDQNPDRFPTPDHALAYWINAYNAFVLRGVIDAYPVKSVKDIALLNGFFNRTKFVAGGQERTLNDIENDIIRPQFKDPRIHFVVNCGARSCPVLEARAYQGADLQQRLEAATRRTLNDARYVRYDAAAQKLHLSKIFDWYKQDFIDWMPPPAPPQPTLVDYVKRYSENSEALDAAEAVKVSFNDYDWHLNEQP